MAAYAQGFVDAGATQVSVIDILPMALMPVEEQLTALSRSIEVCRILKEKNA